MDTRDIMREKIDRDFLYFSPIGATLGRKERHIGFVESNYMSTMGALNAENILKAAFDDIFDDDEE